MAVINMGVIVTDIRGKLGGNQFNKSRAGNVLQRKCNQKKGGSQEQSRRRAAFADFAKYWRTLSDSERAQNNANTTAYPVLDRFGNTKYLSGYQLLLRSNINLRTIGQAPIAVVPATPPLAAGIELYPAQVTVVAGAVTEAYFETAGPTGDYTNKLMVLYVSPGVSPGITNYNGRYNYAGQYALGEALNMFTIQYPIPLTIPTVGDKIFIIVDIVDVATGIVVNSYRGSGPVV